MTVRFEDQWIGDKLWINCLLFCEHVPGRCAGEGIGAEPPILEKAFGKANDETHGRKV